LEASCRDHAKSAAIAFKWLRAGSLSTSRSASKPASACISTAASTVSIAMLSVDSGDPRRPRSSTSPTVARTTDGGQPRISRTAAVRFAERYAPTILR
jgi:hypothetical protein